MLAKVYVFLLVAVIGINGWNVEIPETDKTNMKIGQKKYIVCAVSLEENETNNIIPVITWFKSGVAVPPEKILSRGGSKKDSMTKTLYFENPTNDDNGDYSCNVTIEGSQVTKDKSLRIHFKVGAKFFETPKEHYFVEGKMAKVPCNVIGDDVIIKWFKNGTAIEASAKYYTHDRHSLSISNFSKPDGGIYSCVWIQDLQNETMDIEVIAYEKPQFVQFMKVNNALEGHYFEVKCLAMGAPKPAIQWFKSAKIAKQVPSDYHDEFKNGSLILRNVSLTDAGSYNCVAKSLFDTISRDMLVNVVAKPQIVSSKEMVEGNNGGNTTLTCEFRGEGPLVARWMRNGEKKVEERFAFINATQVLKLTIKTVEVVDMGAYICEVANEAGMVSRVVQFNVHVSPHVRSHHIVRPVVAIPHTNEELMCSAIGYPEPTWTWYFNNGTHKSDLNETKHAAIIVIEGGISKLNISDLSEFGNYTCVASNVHGNDSAIISVIELVSPSTPSLTCFAGNTTDSIHCTDNDLMNGTILNPPRSYMVYYLEENDASKACCSSGPTFKNCTHTKIPVENAEGHLWISKMKPSTKYVLRVAAENEAGESETSDCIYVSTEEVSATTIWAIVLYVIIALLALVILIDLICCITKNKGMIASLYRRCRSKLQRKDNPILEETEISTYESNVITSSNREPLFA